MAGARRWVRIWTGLPPRWWPRPWTPILAGAWQEVAAVANTASRLLLRLVDQVADSGGEDRGRGRAVQLARPFTWDFTGGAGGTRIDAALQRLCVLSVLTRADVERMRGKLHGASP